MFRFPRSFVKANRLPAREIAGWRLDPPVIPSQRGDPDGDGCILQRLSFQILPAAKTISLPSAVHAG